VFILENVPKEALQVLQLSLITDLFMISSIWTLLSTLKEFSDALSSSFAQLVALVSPY
jgi:hypothetical protein